MNSTRAKRIPRITDERAAQRRLYNLRRLRYLAEHPFCQIVIACRGLDEAAVIAGKGWVSGFKVPRANQIHHRNKARHERLLDERWWMSASVDGHNYVEMHKRWARENGFLLPMQADADGRWGSGNQALETPAFMASQIK